MAGQFLLVRKPYRRKALAAACIFFLFFLFAHFYDPPLNPGYAAVIAAEHETPPEQNGFYAYVGFNAPMEMDPHEYGRDIERKSVVWLNSWRLDIAQLFFDRHTPSFQPDMKHNIAFKNELEGMTRFEAKSVECWLKPKSAWLDRKKETKDSNYLLKGKKLGNYVEWHHPCLTAQELESYAHENAELLQRYGRIFSYPQFSSGVTGLLRLHNFASTYYSASEQYKDTAKLYAALLVKRARAGQPEEALQRLISLMQGRQRAMRGELTLSQKLGLGDTPWALGTLQAIISLRPKLASKYSDEIIQSFFEQPYPHSTQDLDASFRAESRQFLPWMERANGIGNRFFIRPNATKNSLYTCLQELKDTFSNDGDNSPLPQSCTPLGDAATALGYNLAGKAIVNSVMPLVGARQNSPRTKTEITGYKLYLTIMAAGISSEQMPAYLAATPPELWHPVSGKPFVWNAEKQSIESIAPGDAMDEQYRFNITYKP